MESPLVSVIIASFNGAAFLPGAIQSALRQSYSRIEVLVVDDGSTDETPAVVAPFLNDVAYIQQPHRGLPAARNAGIRMAKGELLAFLDADDEWLPEKLACQLPHLYADDGIALVHSDLIYLDVGTGRQFHVDRRRDRFQKHCFAELFAGSNITPSTVVARRSCVDTIGGFDETLRTGCEDYDLFLRLARRYPFAYEARALTLYRLHSQSMTSNSLRMSLSEIRVVEKTLRSDPEVESTVGPVRVRTRLRDTYAEAARQLLRSGNAPEARRHLAKALRLDVWAPDLWTLLGRTLLPERLVNAAGRLRRRIHQNADTPSPSG
jgi:glycosyltransferase involved in cell wall biosynthesis